MAIKTAFFSALLALASVSGLLLSPEPLTHNQAVMFCATHRTHLADVTSSNLEQVKHELNQQPAWIRSWDYNFYNNACIQFVNGHIGQVNCEEKHVAACNNPVVLKSTHEEHQAHAQEGEKAGARASRRPHHKPCDSSLSSSSVPCAVDCAYEYVYLTNTVSQVYTSVSTTTVTTGTVTSFNIIGTVAAYTVSAPV